MIVVYTYLKEITYLQPLRVGVPALLPVSSAVVSIFPTEPDEPLLCNLGVVPSNPTFSALCGLRDGTGGEPCLYILADVEVFVSDLEAKTVEAGRRLDVTCNETSRSCRARIAPPRSWSIENAARGSSSKREDAEAVTLKSLYAKS